MKKLLIIVSIGLFFASCSKDTDLSKDITPRISPNNDMKEVLERISTASSDEERLQILSNNEWLTSRLVVFARQLSQIPDKAVIDSVVYYFGSTEAQAEDNTKKIFNGKIMDETVGFIYFNGSKEPVGIIVYCQNGTFGAFEGDGLRRLGQTTLEFTIAKGKGINHYVDYQTSISLAQRFDLLLYKGKKLVTNSTVGYDEARLLEPDLDNTQVTVLVYEGDHFNLRDMTYTRGF